MKFYSTRRSCLPVTAREAVMAGLAPDGGLYMPESIPALPQGFLSVPRSFAEIALGASSPFLTDEVPADVLSGIAQDLMSFAPQLVRLNESDFVLELFHGPTMAFKDYGARFMARLMSFFNQGEDRELTILVATSGDTGSAVASGFFQVPGIRVIILYPSGKVSPLQEKQLTTLGGNITALEIRGVFDDCQRLVKQAFTDPEVLSGRRLTSANSINIARLIPQSFYYMYAASLLESAAGSRTLPVFSVPSGNFGNLTAGLFAARMGMETAKFIAATNVNRVVIDYLETGDFAPRPSVSTLSNAMDVGNPSNFARMLELYGGDWRRMREEIEGLSFSDEETEAAMAEVYGRFGYCLDPHGAVGWLALSTFRKLKPAAGTGVVCETAHPAKFMETVARVIPEKIQIPNRLAAALNKEKEAVILGPEYAELKAYLMS